MNLIERWFAELTNKWIRRGTHRSVRELETSIREWIRIWNAEPRPYVWTKSADEIFGSLAHIAHGSLAQDTSVLTQRFVCSIGRGTPGSGRRS